MVSKARLDLPEPESPVTTMRRSRGISSEMFLRLCTRAPCTAIVVRAEGLGVPRPPPLVGPGPEGAALVRFRLAAALDAIGWFLQVSERQLLHVDVALLRETDGGRG